MTDKLDDPLDDLRQEILRSKLGRISTWTIPAIKKTVGPFDLSPFEAYETECRKLVKTCAEQLMQYSLEQLEELASAPGTPGSGIRNEWRQFRDTEIRTLWGREPPWHAGGFGHPDHIADFETWCRMEQFKLSEIVCLSVGIGPAEFDDQSFEEPKRSDSSKVLPTTSFLRMRYEQFQRKFSSGGYRTVVYPTDFLDWVETVELEVHPEFLGLLKRFHGKRRTQLAPDPTPATTAPATDGAGRPDGREIATVAKLILAIAMEEYGYQPGSPRSPIPKEISEIAAKHGIDVTPETVRRYLLMGAKYLSPGE